MPRRKGRALRTHRQIEAVEAEPAGARQPAVVTLAAVSKLFRRASGGRAVKALSEVTLEVAEDSFVALLGPSGCGKTTLLRLVDGLIAPDDGAVRVFGAPPRPGPRIGFVFQSFRLIPWKTVEGNLAFALDAAGIGGGERRGRIAHYLDLVGLTRFADAYPHELSGGMKQRAALARALATEPEILLMDEPFASVDALARETMQIELMRLWARRRGVVLFVTHSIDEAILLADRVVLMSPRPGRIVGNFAVALPRPRWDYDVRAHPAYLALRRRLWTELRAMMAGGG
jgi:NitT/TauT family transport system ATP-binding protein